MVHIVCGNTFASPSRQSGSNNRDNASPRSLFTFPLVILIVLVLVRGTVTNSSTAPGALAPSSLANRVVVVLPRLAPRDARARPARDANPSNTSSCNGARVTTPYVRAPEPSRTRETRSESSPSTTSSPPRDAARAVVSHPRVDIQGNGARAFAWLRALCVDDGRARAIDACAAVRTTVADMFARARRLCEHRCADRGGVCGVDVMGGWFEKVTAHRAHFLAGKWRHINISRGAFRLELGFWSLGAMGRRVVFWVYRVQYGWYS